LPERPAPAPDPVTPFQATHLRSQTMKRFLCGLGVFSVLGLVAAGCVASDPSAVNDDEDEITNEAAVADAPIVKAPTKDQAGQAKPSGNAKPGGNGISYHGGSLILGTTNVYLIWYGNWSGNAAVNIITDLATSIGGSPYFNINTTYKNGAGTAVTNSVHYAGTTSVSTGYKTSLSDADIQAVVSNAISTNALPKDTNAVYFVLTSADVTASSGFCTQYCGWHTHGTIAGSDIKYSFVGDSTRCPSACQEQVTGPNGASGGDGMASIFSHELEEAVTDPDLNAYYDTKGAENADKCAWTFGTTSTASNGTLKNVHIGSRDYLIQQNWVNASGGYCAMQY
jgi:hypothetical protein